MPRRKQKRSLYQCFCAQVRGDRIKCSEGHALDARKKDGGVNIEMLARGAPLEFTVCQSCGDYNEMGPPVDREDRGWQKA